MEIPANATTTGNRRDRSRITRRVIRGETSESDPIDLLILLMSSEPVEGLRLQASSLFEMMSTGIFNRNGASCECKGHFEEYGVAVKKSTRWGAFRHASDIGAMSD